jgi:Domain of Unknown Function (DUF748)
MTVPDPASTPPSKTPRTDRKRRWRWRIILGLIVLICLTFVVRFLLSVLLPTVLNKVAKTYDLACSYDRLDLSLIGGTAAIWNLEVTPKEGGDPIFHADYCQGDISLYNLLKGRLVVYRVAADGVDMTVERTADGKIPLLARFASSSPAKPAPVSTNEPRPFTLEAPLRVDALRLQHVRARFHDEFVKPELDARLALDLRLSNLGTPGIPTRFELDFDSDPLLDSLQITGRGESDGKTLTAELHVLMRGLHPKPAAGYLALAGLQPTADMISASMSGLLKASIAPDPKDGLQAMLNLSDAQITCDGDRAAGMDHLSLDVQSLAPGSAKLGKLIISGVRVKARRGEDGNLGALGLEFSPLTPPAAPVAPPVAAPAIAAGPVYRWSLGQFALEDLHAGFADASVSPPVVMGVDLKRIAAENFVCDPDHPDSQVNFSADISAPGLVKSIEVSGQTKPFAGNKPFSLTASAVGIAPDVIEPYLKAAGLVSEWRDGTLSLSADGSLMAGEGGKITASAHLSNLTLADGRQLLKFANVGISGAKLNPAVNLIHVDSIDVSGPDVNLQRDAGGDLHVLGFKTTTRPASNVVAVSSPPPAAEASTPPNLEIDHFSWKGVHVSLTDNAVQPVAMLAVSDAGLSMENFAIYPSGDAPSTRHGKIHAWIAVPGVAPNLILDGSVTSTSRHTSVEFDVHGDRIRGEALSPYLKALGAESTLQNGSLKLHTELDMDNSPEGLAMSFSGSDWNFSDGDQSLVSVKSLQVDGLRSRPGEMSLDAIRVASPHLRVMRNSDGIMELVGLRFVGKPPPDSSPEPVAIDPPAAETPFAANIKTLQIRDAAVEWLDQSVHPVVDTVASSNIDLNDFQFSPKAHSGSIRVTTSVSGSIDEIMAEGTLSVSPDDQTIALNLSGHGIRAGQAEAYLPPSTKATMQDGRLRTSINFSAARNPKGGKAIELTVSGLDLRDGEAKSSLLDFDSFHMKVSRFDPGAKLIALDDVTLKGLDVGLRKTLSGIDVLGLELQSQPAATAPAAPVRQSTSAAPPPTRVDTLSQIAQRRSRFPLVLLQSLDLGIRKITVSDDTQNHAVPFVVSDLHLRNTSKIAWLGRDTEANPPTDLELTGRLDPLADLLKVEVHVVPFSRQKTLAVDFALTGIHGDGLTELNPQLASRIDPAGLKSGQFTASMTAALKLQTVEPTDFTMQYGGKLDFDLKDADFRGSPAGPILAGVGEVHSDGIIIKPNSGGVEVRELEIDNIAGQVTRDRDGIHVLGLTLKSAPPAATQPATAPAPAPTPETSPQIAPAIASSAPASSVFKIDRLLVSGMDFRFEDQTTDPPVLAPINGLDVEVQGLSNLALSQAIPIRFSVLVNSAKVPLPSVRKGADQLEQRDLFSQITSSGEVSLYPQLKGWAKASVNGFELVSLYGLAEQEKLKLGGGTFDGDVDIRFPGDGTVDTSTRLILTDLSLSEPPNGIISRTLKLPAPLDIVIGALQDQDGSITIPLNVSAQRGQLNSGSIVASGVSALAQIITTAIAASPLKLASLVGLGGGNTDKEPPLLVTFPPGYSGLGPEQTSALRLLIARLQDDKTLQVALRHDLGNADITLAAERVNPSSDDALALAGSLSRRRAALLAARSIAASDVRALLASDATEDAERAVERLRTINRQLADNDNALDHIYDFLRAGADRQAMRRTRSASLAIAKSRLEAVRDYLQLVGGKKISPDRIHLTNPQFTPAQDNSTGGVTILVVKTK